MSQRENFGTLCSRLGVESLCPHCLSKDIIKSGKNSQNKQRSGWRILSRTIGAKHRDVPNTRHGLQTCAGEGSLPDYPVLAGLSD